MVTLSQNNNNYSKNINVEWILSQILLQGPEKTGRVEGSSNKQGVENLCEIYKM